jgi:hypothetical protein
VSLTPRSKSKLTADAAADATAAALADMEMTERLVSDGATTLIVAGAEDTTIKVYAFECRPAGAASGALLSWYSGDKDNVPGSTPLHAGEQTVQGGGLPWTWPYCPRKRFETNEGEDLFMNNGGSGAAIVTVWYRQE